MLCDFRVFVFDSDIDKSEERGIAESLSLAQLPLVESAVGVVLCFHNDRMLRVVGLYDDLAFFVFTSCATCDLSK